jgi:hypothetical protein
MDNRAKSVYLGEISQQCNFALNAVGNLNQALKALEVADKMAARQLAQAEIFRSIHSLLTHASNVSRLLWPLGTDGPRAERGRILREALGIDDGDHPLRTRRLRDHLEHFDERLDDWQASSSRHNFVQDNVGPWGVIAGIDERDVMRWYDQAAKKFIFRGESFNVQEIVSEVEALRLVASRESAGAWRAPIQENSAG